jgi:hypothetical protein
MTQQHLAESTQHARLLGMALNERTAKLHIIAGAIAHAWVRYGKAGLDISDALECVRNALCALQSDVGITHVMHDAIEHRRANAELYPAWRNVSGGKAITLTAIALGVWCGKGWRL